MPPIKISCLFVSFAIGLGAFAPQTMAQKTYKWVDEKGVVNYGPVPPANDKAATVNTAPALTKRSSGACPGVNCYDSASDGAYSAQDNQERAEKYMNEQRARQEQITAAQEQRRNQLMAECERNRGTDCKNPATLRDIENSQRPYSGRRY